MENHFPSEPLVSCLCVTEGRPAFMPWLLRAFDCQTWPRRELVVIDSSPVPWRIAGRDDVRVFAAPPGSKVASKRNQALRAAAGDCVCWFDDDDWQHPRRLEVLLEALRDGAMYAGIESAWFVNLKTLYGEPYRGFKHRILFNSAMFRRACARQVAFKENILKASDTLWMSDLEAAFPGSGRLVKRSDLFFWLCHESNLSNPARRRNFSAPLERFITLTGPDAWGDTSTALDELKARLKQAAPAQTPAPISTPQKTVAVLPGPHKQNTQPDTEHQDPPVGVMIKATVLDVPYLEVMVRHMLAQAHYPFAERVIVVDRRMEFSGKYRDRPRMNSASLDKALDRLVSDGVIDAVKDVDMRPDLVREINERYFGGQARNVPTHASTGGPIYPTLFGMEMMASDYVLQMDGDLFFHSKADSWVSAALKHLLEDPSIWLMMTHPGPPAGSPGASLGTSNLRRASWDKMRRIWRFRQATTRYFLCDRRNLHGKLVPIFRAGGCAPLENLISLALQRNGAFRGALGDLNSWHLHSWYHGTPFPDWAEAIARQVEAGRYPEIQRGEYDLRLDRPPSQSAWARLIHDAGKDSESQPTRRVNAYSSLKQPQANHELLSSKPKGKGPQTVLEAPGIAAEGKRAPIAVIIPVRNRAGQRLKNALASLNWQTSGRPAQVLLVSHGSRSEVNRELQAICTEAGAALLAFGDSAQPWNKPLALNVGIQNTSEEVPYLMTMDADVILAPNFIDTALTRLQQPREALVLCRISDLPQRAVLPSEPDKLRESYESLRRLTSLRPSTGSGGIQAARRAFFYQVHGYDEDLLWWGAMDGDMLIRGRLVGLEVAWIESATSMLHQWHPRKHSILQDSGEIAQARRFWVQNHELVRQRNAQPVRNLHGWGDPSGGTIILAR